MNDIIIRDNSINKVKKDAQFFIVLGEKLLKQSQDLKITNNTELQDGSYILKGCQIAESDLENKRIEIVKPLGDFVKEANTLFKETAVSILEAKNVTKQKMLEWNQEQERIKREEEEKRFAEEQARLRKLEEERLERERIEKEKREEEEKRLAQERERLRKLEEERIEKEMKSKQASEEEKQKALAVAEAQRQEREKLENDRLDLERQKREVEEEKLRQEEQKKIDAKKRLDELEVSDREKQLHVKGVYKLWQWEITDELSIPREFCSPDSKKINEAIKKGAREIQGLRIYQSTLVK